MEKLERRIRRLEARLLEGEVSLVLDDGSEARIPGGRHLLQLFLEANDEVWRKLENMPPPVLRFARELTMIERCSSHNGGQMVEFLKSLRVDGPRLWAIDDEGRGQKCTT